jgi:RND family efflux transporter MFP subunit
MRKKLLIVVPIVVFLGLAAWALLPRFLGSGEEGPAQLGVPVLAVYPTRGEIERVLSYSATLSPTHTITVSAKVPGRLEEILVEEGQTVQRDEILAIGEDEAVRLQMRQAYAAWQAAEAQSEKAKKGIRTEELENARALLEKVEEDLFTAEESFNRSEQLYKSGTISKAEYETAESRLRGARTELENAGRTLKMMEAGGSREDQEAARSNAAAMEASYELARLQVDNTRIAAPESGTVARLLQEEGNIVGSGMPILILVQDDPIHADIAVPERYYGEVAQKLGRIEARLSVAAYPENTVFSGRVIAISPTVHTGSRTFEVTVEIENANRLLRLGMYARVDLVMEKIAGALLIPRSALLDREEEKIVFVVQEDGEGPRASIRKVRLGISNPGEVQILSGLSAQERIIVEGNAFLEDGQLVRILERR